MSHYLQVFFVFLSFLASLTTFIRPVANLYLRIFPFFLLLTLVVEMISYYLIVHHRPNTALYNFFAVLEFEFYFFILRMIIRNPNAKKVILYLLWVYPLAALSDIIFIQRFNNFAAVGYSLASLVIVVLTIYYFLELYQRPRAVNLISDPPFWICSGLLLFYCCSLPIFGMTNFLAQATWFNAHTLEVILDLMNILLYFIFTIAFLCRVKMRKSIS
jgi:hypothetical protein